MLLGLDSLDADKLFALRGDALGFFLIRQDIDDLTQDEKGVDEKEKKPCLTMLSTFTPQSAKEFVELNRDVAIDTIKEVKGSENLVALIDWLLTFPPEQKTVEPNETPEEKVESTGAPKEDDPKDKKD